MQVSEAENRPKPPFIPNQRIERLVLPTDERRYLRDYLFGGRELKKRGSDGKLETVPIWLSDSLRSELLTDSNHRLLCISTDAGYGKTKSTIQAQLLRQSKRGHIVIRVDLKVLPDREREYLDDGDHSFLIDHLERRYRELHEAKILRPRPPKLHELQMMLRSAIKHGEFTLIVDGLDQTNPERGKILATQLRLFLATYKAARCIVAGRTSAIFDFWTELFATRKDLYSESASKESAWEFARVTLFDEDQIKRFIGRVRYDHLHRIEAHELFVPRLLEALNALSDERFLRIRNAAEAYWECVDQTMVEDFEKRKKEIETSLNREEFIDLLGLIAWSLMAWKESGPEDSITKTEYPKFLEYIFDRRENLPHPKLRRADIEMFESYLQDAARINASYVNFIFSSERDIESWKWQNPTLRDFFAALHVCRNDSDYDWLACRQPISSHSFRNEFRPELSRNLPFYVLWRSICDMPHAAWQMSGYTDTDKQLWAIRTLFERRTEKRPCEMMYRAWTNLMQRLTPGSALFSEKELQQATQKSQRCVSSCESFQSSVEREFAYQDGIPTPINDTVALHAASPTAKGIVSHFLKEFLELSEPSNAIQHILREDMLDHWKGCNSREGLKFQCGHHEQIVREHEVERILEERFLLCAYEVTNRIYSLFDPHHSSWFNRDEVADKYRENSPYARGPAIYLSWYDAWMFATWSHSRLPTESEWEYACRANKLSGRHNAKYYFGDNDDDLPSHAWIHTNSKEPEQVKANVSGSHAHSVGTRATTHPFGLHDMLGNVREWCLNKYMENSDLRCCRGGSFTNGANYAHCSFRYSDDPRLADRVNGVRVARSDL